jgi:putative Holliday junction resolvase
MARALGLDVGDKRIGIALADPLGLTAQGLPTLERRNMQSDLEAVSELCREHEVGTIVVGLPLNMDGSEGPRAAISRRFGEKLGERTGLPVEMWDERLTTVEAERVLLSANVSRGKRRKVIDKLAAQVILQSWLDAHSSRCPDPPEEDM